MQTLFIERTNWHVPWLERVLPAVVRLAEARRERTVFTRFVPPERPEDAAGAWRRYSARWRNMTGDRLDPRLIQLVPPLAPLVPPAIVIDKAHYLFAFSLAAAAPLADRPSNAEPARNGIVTGRSAYAMDETIDRLKRDIASKGITFFAAIDQSELATKADIKLRPSTLLVFGNPALGAQFITSNPVAGLDWPVRLLVFQDENGAVGTAYTDFGWIAQRHRIGNREAAFSKASEVIASITSSVKDK